MAELALLASWTAAGWWIAGGVVVCGHGARLWGYGRLGVFDGWGVDRRVMMVSTWLLLVVCFRRGENAALWCCVLGIGQCIGVGGAHLVLLKMMVMMQYTVGLRIGGYESGLLYVSHNVGSNVVV